MHKKYVVGWLILCTIFAHNIYPNIDPDKQLWYMQDPEAIMKEPDLNSIELKNTVTAIVSLLYKKPYPFPIFMPISMYLPQAFITCKNSHGQHLINRLVQDMHGILITPSYDMHPYIPHMSPQVIANIQGYNRPTIIYRTPAN